MRHQGAFRKLSRSSSHRRSLLRNLATSLVLKGSIETTVEKAKELKRTAEKLVGIAKKDTLASRRKAYSFLLDKEAVGRLFSVVAPSHLNRPGGYTRVVRTGYRHGDAASMAVIQFVDSAVEVKSQSSAVAAK